MRIGIDIDDTISYTSQIMNKKATEYDKKYLRGEGLINLHKQYFYERFNWTTEEVNDFYHRYYEDIVPEIRVREDAKEIIEKLKNDGHTIFIITIRSYKYLHDPYSITYKWLSDNDIVFDQLIVNATNKGEICSENKIDLLIDDSVDNCYSAINYNINTLLFNGEHNIENTTLKRVYDWYEIYNLIKDE